MFTDDKFKFVSKTDKYGRLIQDNNEGNKELEELYLKRTNNRFFFIFIFSQF